MSENIFAKATFFGTHLSLSISDKQFGDVCGSINHAVLATNTLAENIAGVKVVIDSQILQPLIESFDDKALGLGLSKAYGLYISDDPDILDTPAKVAASIDSIRRAAEMARVKQLSNNQVIAQTASLAIMDELAGRRGILDDVDDGVYEEIRGAVATIVAETCNAK